MPQLAFANSFWESYDMLEKPIKAGVRKAMAKFQKLTVAELHADKGLHLESVHNARDSRMRTIRISDFWRGVVLAPDDGSDTFLLLSVVPHDGAYTWAAKRLYTVNTATRALEVRNVVAIEQLTPALEQAAAAAPTLLFADHSDTVLRDLGIDEQVMRAVRTIIDKPQLDAFGSLLPEDQFEVLQFLAEGFAPDEVYRDVVAERQPVHAVSEAEDSLARAIANTTSRITLVTGPDELADILDKPFAAWRVFLHPSQRRVAYRFSYNGPAQVTGGPGTGKTVVALHRVKHLLSRSPDEAQDLHPAQWRVLRAAVAPGADDLFIVGDPHQRIYDSRVSMLSVGIPVAGRTSRLRINYRSTEEILAWSTGLLGGVRVGDLGGDGVDSLAGYRSLLHGKRPRAIGFPSEADEVAALTRRVQEWINDGVRPNEIAVCTRFNVLLDKVSDHLVAAGVPTVRVRDHPGPDDDGVRLASMHAMKGLEFRCVAVIGVTSRAVPFAREVTPADVDRIQHDSDVLRERCVLFVACTRAREALHVSWSGKPSPFLSALS